jgi:tetratricopeptide (TPR) repeat protein
VEETLYDLGRWDEVVASGEETVRLSEEHGYHDAMLAATVDIVLVLTRRGQLAEAARLRPQLLHSARGAGEAQLLVPALVLEALAGNAASEAARELCDVVLTDDSREWLRHLADVARVLGATGQTEGLARLLDRIDSPYPRHRYSLVSAQAVLAEARGDADAAVDLYDEACAAWTSFGCPFEQAQALLGAGRTRLTAGRADAADHLERALALFETMGATAAGDEAAASLHAAAATR